jgi:hypothetical protein
MAIPQDPQSPARATVQEPDRSLVPPLPLPPPAGSQPQPPGQPLNDFERRLLADLFAIVSEHAADSAPAADLRSVTAPA